MTQIIFSSVQTNFIHGFVPTYSASNLSNLIGDISNIYKLLNYNNPVVLEIAIDILRECFKQSKNDIKISRTGENEILIYRIVNGEYRNIILDNDGDIEFLKIPVNRADTYNENHPFITLGNDMQVLVSKI